MCTVLLPPGDNPIAVNKYIISYLNLQIGSEANQLVSQSGAEDTINGGIPLCLYNVQNDIFAIPFYDIPVECSRCPQI